MATLWEDWEYSGKTVGIAGNALAILEEYNVNTVGILWEYHGNAVGMMWEYSGNAMAIIWYECGIFFGAPWEYYTNVEGILL